MVSSGPCRYSDSDHTECEGVCFFDSVSVTFVHIAGAHAYRDQGATVTSNSSSYATDACPVCPVCNVGVLWANGCIDQNSTWYGGRRPRRHCARWRLSSLTERGTAVPHFSAQFALARSPISATARLLLHRSQQTNPYASQWAAPFRLKIALAHGVFATPPIHAVFIEAWKLER